MAREERTKNRKTFKRPELNYFFVNGDLHAKLSKNRGKDLLTAWNYPAAKKVSYSLTDVLKRYEPAFTTQQVAAMVNRRRLVLSLAISNGMIEPPQHTYNLETRNMYQYMWSEKDIMGLLDYLSTVHRGRPRIDGEITPQHLPTPRELRAMIHNEPMMYVKSGDTFIPSWKAKEW
jgi:hypothetical protein